jgi:hypothetical protein
MKTMTHIVTNQNRDSQLQRQPQARFFIYENRTYLRDRCFDKDCVSIGSNPKADVVLKHNSVKDIHALVNFDGGTAFLTNKFPNNGLRLNGRSVHLEKLNHDDVIDIGPFSLKIRMEASAANASPASNKTCAVRLLNHYDSPEAVRQAAERLAELLNSDAARVLPLVEKDHVVIKKNLGGLEAARWQNTLLKAGIICDVQIGQRVEPIPPDLSQRDVEANDAVEPAAAAMHTDTAAVHEPEAATYVPSGIIYTADPEDDEEDVWEAPFALSEALVTAPLPDHGGDASNKRLQVVKIIGDGVLDATMLKGNQKYYLTTEGGRTCFVHHHPDESSLYLTPQLTGYIVNSSGETIADLNSYKIESYLSARNRSLYRVPIPPNGTVVVNDGECRYRISVVYSRPSPTVTVPATPAAFNWRHWALSAGAHAVFLLCICLYFYFQAVAPKTADLHFVKIDPSMLKRLEPVPPPKPPKKEPPPKPEPRKMAQPAQPPKKTPVAKKTDRTLSASKTRKPGKAPATTAKASKHPNAGGGFGEGNIKNRNINQTGLLSVLGGTTVSGPSDAIAAVTNLDAVSVPGATQNNFTVGGLKGSLGNGKIAVATGEMVQTKGSRQVLRSAGAGGTGEVAAMERGTTGKKQVQAMVTATLSRTVKIEGGMSREMVKRVIDQHLEDITYCYETALMSNPSILGRIVFEWKILMDGRVGEIRIVASSVNSHEIHDCIKSAIKSWRFPKPVGSEVVVSYPFVFDLVAF